ncbi:histidinol dehydrogenase [Fulvivirga sp. M361]|uniref:histidinol dehydrogenase n=1 Tax=Fulvivirga sp. M361 TaxID=2594266 RepID=UPI0011799BDF|nr:histidinol dehydrogenase [Fulvivirga sp. M361]TRX52370.1 histidinol dehydrogenase [Fulvivirga sp. M361]
MQIINNPNPSEWAELLTRPVFEAEFLQSAVKNILNRVRTSGDQALIDFNLKFDQAVTHNLSVTQEEITSAIAQVETSLKDAIRKAADNIHKFHKAQERATLEVETMPGVTCWRKSVAIPNVGIYIPGGTAPLFSTVLMLGIPASIAGCNEIVLCTPPGKDGTIHPAILFAADLVGVTKIYKTGGAQAVAAMAYGTETVPKVDKIFGPGNQYVTEAKQQVSLEGIAIDMPAGPSELAIIADETAEPAFIASDLLSQAEHGNDSQVILICTDEAQVAKVNRALDEQLASLPRKEMAGKSLQNSKAIIVPDLTIAVALSNAYAPEHLIICTKEAETVAEEIVNAGSVFIGDLTPESAGDYASGTNHTLPTNGAARAYSGVSLDSFTKQITYQKIDQAGLKSLGPAIEEMAAAEQLEAHKRAVTIRLEKIGR